jgi:hypothetical protein
VREVPNRCASPTHVPCEKQVLVSPPALRDAVRPGAGVGTVPRTGGGRMKLTEDIKPVTYMKTRAAELLREVKRSRRPVVITQRCLAAPPTHLSGQECTPSAEQAGRHPRGDAAVSQGVDWGSGSTSRGRSSRPTGETSPWRAGSERAPPSRSPCRWGQEPDAGNSAIARVRCPARAHVRWRVGAHRRSNSIRERRGRGRHADAPPHPIRSRR